MVKDAVKTTVFCLFVLCFIAGCGGGGFGTADTPPGVNPGQVSLLKLMPDRNVAQTGSFAFFHARVLDGNGMPIAGKNVNFTNISVGATLSATSAVTDKDGIAKVSVRMTHSGYATVIAEVEGFRDKRSLLFTTLNSIRGFALNPILVLLDADRNLNGIYNEADDFRVCQAPNTNVVRVRATAYVMGVRTGGLRVGISSDYPSLVTFPNTPLFDGTTNTYYLTTNSQGEATVDVTVNCQLQPNELLFNIFAITDAYYVEDFDKSFRGTGGMSLFLQPVTITGINLTADPSTAIVNGISNIRAVVNTSIGPAPDNTAVQLYTTCGTITPTPAMTLNGVATAVFTAPSYIPQGGICSVVAKVGNQTATVNITITGQLRVDPSTLTINGTTGGTATFTVSGGIPGYRIYSNNAAFAPNPTTLNTSGSSFTVTVPANTSAQTVTFTILDSQSNSVTATLNITATGESQLTISPISVTIAPGESATFVISGGTAPYTLTSSRPSLLTVSPATVTSSGGTFTVTAGTVTASTDVTITARDANGNMASATVTIDPRATTT
ncbi:MAG: Ig-like domain-containing protein, partial [Thermodesulfovibrionales bacterium]|nr:Ig-like domain-containing protein [Thermodesulfovibrionales bacterium]